jgi:hypothetical protein
MKAYVSKDGKQYGPYPVEQLRKYVQEGNFTAEDLACHDGQNWVKVAEVPGFATGDDTPTTPQQPQAVQEDSLDANTKATEFTATSSVLGIASIILVSIPLVIFLCIFLDGADKFPLFLVFLFFGVPMLLVGLILSIIGLNLRRGTTTGKKRCRIGLYLVLIMPLWLLLCIFWGEVLE